MWIMTPRGFYSVVAHREREDQVLVRARCRDDIDALADLLPGEPIAYADADYAWRLVASRDAWQAALARMAAEIDYPSFKGAIDDPDRHGLYLEVWRVLRVLDDR